jgi:protein-tyrosine phosphatase
VAAANWIALRGAVNVRDVGGVRARGGVVRRRRLIRADNLQDLTPGDVHTLVGELGVRAVADLRSSEEVVSEGPGLLNSSDLVRIHHLSLVPEVGNRTDAAALERDEHGSVILPWHRRDAEPSSRPPARDIYRNYLVRRADSVLGALRLVARTDGATLVHCAAGKDRTGVVVALALAEVGVGVDDIVEDYERSAERIELIFQRLAASPTYRADMQKSLAANHKVAADAIRGFLTVMDDEYGGTSAALRSFGWTDDDHEALTAALVET